MTYEELQAEQWTWASERFGPERSALKALQPLAGCVEELGELDEAIHQLSRNDIEDAIGDCVIYLCDLCNRMQWQMPLPSHAFGSVRNVGRLAHAVLKSAQGIRQNEDHATAGVLSVSRLLGYLDNVAAHWHLGDALSCAETAWQEVSQRSVGHAAIPDAEQTA